jgi:hypothetical protein
MQVGGNNRLGVPQAHSGSAVSQVTNAAGYLR